MAMFGGSTEKMLDIMHKSMSAATMRNDVLNNNIANATTPNYKRQDITFQTELERAIASESAEEEVPFTTTNEKHIPIARAKDYRSIIPKKTTEYNTLQNNNGNSVDIDKEMLESAKNTMYFNALAQREAKEFNMLKFILKS
jgi:flagellar basal-body rod protein FlgB